MNDAQLDRYIFDSMIPSHLDMNNLFYKRHTQRGGKKKADEKRKLSLGYKASIHNVTTMLSISNYVLFPG